MESGARGFAFCGRMGFTVQRLKGSAVSGFLASLVNTVNGRGVACMVFCERFGDSAGGLDFAR